MVVRVARVRAVAAGVAMGMEVVGWAEMGKVAAVALVWGVCVGALVSVMVSGWR